MQAPDNRSTVCPLRLPAPTDVSGDAALLRFLAVVRKRRRFLLAMPLAAGALTLLACLLIIPTTYLSLASLLPTQTARQQDMLSSTLSDKLPITFDFMEHKEERVIMAFLLSLTLQERLLADPELLQRLYDRPWDRLLIRLNMQDSPSAARAIQEKRLERIFRVRHKTGDAVINLSWEARDPDFAARMLERVIEEMRRYLEREHVSDASRQRRFIESQAAQASAELAAWEARAPGAGLSLPRIQREIIAAAALHAELQSRLAMARIDEAREVVTFSVLDEPFRPVKKHWPKTGWLTAGAMALGLLLGLLLVFLHQALDDSREVHAGR
ncbi:hypothetical protein PCS_03120 [Desulfocurvibacter africanus PCS]|uniref:Polysaccharide chain length determinant N-terminal domain-containing protein n=1 Tax=Desulfocurvibacter africanus PCS TaxID=1262666 RepID=M5Q124_DESAF|nr:hypothetical protein [Desulfocurvibacter africanus]EMG36178.1 hypothetical protein PCS_03120 [Desulfocurvibacter africanus PCS]